MCFSKRRPESTEEVGKAHGNRLCMFLCRFPWGTQFPALLHEGSRLGLGPTCFPPSLQHFCPPEGGRATSGNQTHSLGLSQGSVLSWGRPFNPQWTGTELQAPCRDLGALRRAPSLAACVRSVPGQRDCGGFEEAVGSSAWGEARGK